MKSSVTLKKSVCPSSYIKELQGSNKDRGTGTTVVEVGIVCGVATEAGGGYHKLFNGSFFKELVRRPISLCRQRMIVP